MSEILSVTFVYGLFGHLLKTYLVSDFLNDVWPLSGLALAALLIGGQHLVGAIVLGSLVVTVFSDLPSWAVFGLAITRALEATLAYQLLSRLKSFDRELRTLKDYVALVLLAGVFSTAVCAVIASLFLFFADALAGQTYFASVLHWWMGDALGMLLITPLIIVWRVPPKDWLLEDRITEFCVVAGLVFLTGQVAFFDWFPESLDFLGHGYALFSLITWAALRFGMQGVSVMLVLTAAQGLLSLKHGQAEHFANTLFGSSLNGYWFYISILSLIGMVLSTYYTDRKRANEELTIAAVAFDAQHGMVITNASGIIIRINNPFTELTGYSKEDILGQSLTVLNSEKQEADFYKQVWTTVISDGKWQGESWIRYKNGAVSPQWFTLTEVRTQRGIVTHYIGTFVDIAARKAAEEEIYKLAFYDPLTGLPNRRLLLDRIHYAIEVVRREGKQLALMMLDLDRFKQVNDSFGHAAGDELLVQVASRLKKRLRDVDLVARLGGDEFVVLLGSITMPQDAARVATMIVTDLSRPFMLSQANEANIGVSIGISLYPQHGDSPELLLEQADVALYQAKNEGRGCFAYFSEKFTIALRERIDLENRLRGAIEKKQLSVVYQPQVAIASGQIVGAQVLVRWMDPEAGLIAPSLFIPVAEDSGLIAPLGEWVLREGCRQAKVWLDQGFLALQLSVKLSAYQIHHGDINTVVATILAETGFPAENLELELPEKSLIEHGGSAEQLQRLRGQGVQLVIDDFGRGFSSLTYLKRFPLDVLKIGKVFIEEKEDMDIAATIVAMAQSLGMKTLAEGVETPEQLDFLESKGCDTYQGYFKSKPLPAEAFARLLR